MMVAPFPWFGGKRTVASQIWARLGEVKNYVEPFMGSGAVLLARPDKAKVETVNDRDHFLCNFWRAIQATPDAVAYYADWPVNEADLQTRHHWLITEGADLISACASDPVYYDAKVAGWWLWGSCAWIGSGWCSGEGPWIFADGEWINRKLPDLSAGQGINRQVPHFGNAGQGINRQVPHFGNAGRGINRQVPHFGNAGQGINRQVPHFGNAGRSEYILSWLSDLSERLRHVRVACGDWSRVCGDCVTWQHGLTGVFLDPPYGVDDRAKVYNHESTSVAAEARDWAITAGKREDMRIAFAGYENEHPFPDNWSVLRWKAAGGYGSRGDGQGRVNKSRETIWFSPACLSPEQADMFAKVSA